eukprot:g5993.t1
MCMAPPPPEDEAAEERKTWKAKDYNEFGIYLAQKKNALHKSIQYFRTAQKRAEDASALEEYLNNEGVTLMRMRLYEQARFVFEKGLEKNPESFNLKRNYDILRDLTPVSLWEFGRPQEHITKRLPRIPADKLMTDPRYEVYRKGFRPFIITGHPLSSKVKNEWSLDYFTKNFGDFNADTYPYNMKLERVKPSITTLKDGLDEFQRGSVERFKCNEKERGMYIQANLNLRDYKLLLKDIGPLPEFIQEREGEWIDECFSEKEANSFQFSTHWRILLFGDENAGMFSHSDFLMTASWQVQLVGSKRWHICPPSQRNRAGEAALLDFFKPDYRKKESARDLVCYDDTLRAGEFLYYPQDYIHQTVTEEELGISLTGTIADSNNWQQVRDRLRGQCFGRRKGDLSVEQDVCKVLEDCVYRKWSQVYGGENDTREEFLKHAETEGATGTVLGGNGEVSALETEVAELRREFKSMMKQVQKATLSDEIDFLKASLAALREMFSTLKKREDVEALKNDLEEVKNDILEVVG